MSDDGAVPDDEAVSGDGAVPAVSHAGRLLVATAVIGDPNFERTVILLIDHDADGTLGLVLNRPSDLATGDVLPGWSDLAVSPGVVFAGGPVESEGIIGLGRRTELDPDGPFQRTVGSVGVVDLSIEPIDAVGRVEGIRFFAGYAAWGPGQLEAELVQSAWWIVDADPADPLTDAPHDLWAAVLRRQPQPLRRWSHFPVDPAWN